MTLICDPISALCAAAITLCLGGDTGSASFCLGFAAPPDPWRRRSGTVARPRLLVRGAASSESDSSSLSSLLLSSASSLSEESSPPSPELFFLFSVAETGQSGRNGGEQLYSNLDTAEDERFGDKSKCASVQTSPPFERQTRQIPPAHPRHLANTHGESRRDGQTDLLERRHVVRFFPFQYIICILHHTYIYDERANSVASPKRPPD